MLFPAEGEQPARAVAHTAAVGGYVPLEGRANFVVTMLYISLGMDAVSILSALLVNLVRTDSNLFFLVETADVVIGGIYVLVFITTAISFLIWVHRASSNLAPLGSPGEHSPGWAVGSWFVPFLNLYRPYTIVKDIWTKSAAPGAPITSVPLGWWWACWIIGNIAGQISFRVYAASDDPQTWLVADIFAIIQSALGIAGALCLIKITRSVTERQHHRGAGAAGVFD